MVEKLPKRIKDACACQNCLDIQTCDKQKVSVCWDFKLCGTIPVKPLKRKNLCHGCREQYYNDHQKDGCWHYKGSKLVLRSSIPSLSQAPPWSLDYMLSCYRKQYH